MSVSFFFTNVEHWVATEIGNLKKGVVRVAAVAPAVEAKLVKIADGTANVVAGVAVAAGQPSVAAAALLLDRASDSVLATTLVAVEAAGEAAGANGLSVTYDAATVTALKQLVATVKTVSPTLLAPPAGVVAPK